MKELVALEIIIDLPIGFPINNIISQSRTMICTHRVMPLVDWDDDDLQEASFVYEDLPEQQQVILAQIQCLKPNMCGHLVGQMMANPSNPVHVPDLPLFKRMLDPEY